MKTTVAINRTDYAHWGNPVEIDTARHTAIIGTTGAGKSTVLLEAILAEIEAGQRPEVTTVLPGSLTRVHPDRAFAHGGRSS